MECKHNPDDQYSDVLEKFPIFFDIDKTIRIEEVYFPYFHYSKDWAVYKWFRRDDEGRKTNGKVNIFDAKNDFSKDNCEWSAKKFMNCHIPTRFWMFLSFTKNF